MLERARKCNKHVNEISDLQVILDWKTCRYFLRVFPLETSSFISSFMISWIVTVPNKGIIHKTSIFLRISFKDTCYLVSWGISLLEIFGNLRFLPVIYGLRWNSVLPLMTWTCLPFESILCWSTRTHALTHTHMHTHTHTCTQIEYLLFKLNQARTTLIQRTCFPHPPPAPVTTAGRKRWWVTYIPLLYCTWDRPSRKLLYKEVS